MVNVFSGFKYVIKFEKHSFNLQKINHNRLLNVDKNFIKTEFYMTY